MESVSYEKPASLMKRRFALMSVKELMELPPTEWLVQGFIEQGVLAVMYGESGHGKSFVALDWALSIATGSRWNGNDVVAGSVLYVVAEGGRNIRKRVMAWLEEHDIEDV